MTGAATDGVRPLGPRAARALLVLWPLLVVLIFVMVGSHAYSTVSDAQRAARVRHAARVDPTAQDIGVTPFEVSSERGGSAPTMHRSRTTGSPHETRAAKHDDWITDTRIGWADPPMA